ncbi:UDP-N-acetylglucosamine 1-carboxyvinyltransferase [Bartonella krasnovii]|uniref:UDP-N-acetylglucosamine 1-carboxyvinyltransferase n=1 Tax=Bartonella krasnovii TaxID=2267275 RepID=UPI003B97DA10
MQGTLVMATDLRGVSLVIAAPLFLLIVAAKGETIVNRVYPLDRGFFAGWKKNEPDVVRKFNG